MPYLLGIHLSRLTNEERGGCQSRVIGLLRERLASRVVYGIAAIASEAAWRIDAESAPPKLHNATQAALAEEASQPSPITKGTGDAGSVGATICVNVYLKIGTRSLPFFRPSSPSKKERGGKILTICLLIPRCQWTTSLSRLFLLATTKCASSESKLEMFIEGIAE